MSSNFSSPIIDDLVKVLGRDSKIIGVMTTVAQKYKKSVIDISRYLEASQLFDTVHLEAVNSQLPSYSSKGIIKKIKMMSNRGSLSNSVFEIFYNGPKNLNFMFKIAEEGTGDLLKVYVKFSIQGKASEQQASIEKYVGYGVSCKNMKCKIKNNMEIFYTANSTDLQISTEKLSMVEEAPLNESHPEVFLYSLLEAPGLLFRRKSRVYVAPTKITKFEFSMSCSVCEQKTRCRCGEGGEKKPMRNCKVYLQMYFQNTKQVGELKIKSFPVFQNFLRLKPSQLQVTSFGLAFSFPMVLMISWFSLTSLCTV